MGINKGVGINLYRMAFDRAFALPTVLITSVVMLTVLLSALTASSSISAGLKNQYLNQLARTASQSGMTMAKACMEGNDGTITWTNDKPLKPNTDCDGTETISCPITATAAACYVLKAGNYRTSFKVKVLTDEDDNPTDISAEGIIREVRKTSGEVIRESKTSLKAKLQGVTSTVGNAADGSLDMSTATASYQGSSYAYVYNTGHACAIADAQLYCWGYNASGQLGDGTTTTRTVPTLVSALAGKNVTKVKTASQFYDGTGMSSKYGSTCAIADGQLYCWGYKGYPGGTNTITPTTFTELDGKKAGAPIYGQPTSTSQLILY